MARYFGGQTVKEGFYLNRSSPELVSIARWDGVLPGDEGTRYTRLPLPAVMVVGPIMGFVYVILLPLVTCFALISCSIRWVANRLKLQSGSTAA
jgi:hypothetical protein